MCVCLCTYGDAHENQNIFCWICVLLLCVLFFFLGISLFSIEFLSDPITVYTGFSLQCMYCTCKIQTVFFIIDFQTSTLRQVCFWLKFCFYFMLFFFSKMGWYRWEFFCWSVHILTFYPYILFIQILTVCLQLLLSKIDLISNE